MNSKTNDNIASSEDEVRSKHCNPGNSAKQGGKGTDEREVPEEVTLILLGKTGAGKSSLAHNLLHKEENPKDTESTKEVTITEGEIQYEGNGVTIKVLDNVGLLGSGKKRRKENLKKLSKHPDAKKADLAIYCISVSPGVRFEAENPQIMKTLQDTFGKYIWKHCIIALTFSNLALEHANKMDKENPGRKWEKTLKDVTEAFQTQLNRQKVKGVETILVLPTSETTSSMDDATPTIKIPALPAGLIYYDKVWPQAKNHTTTGEDPPPQENKLKVEMPPTLETTPNMEGATPTIKIPALSNEHSNELWPQATEDPPPQDSMARNGSLLDEIDTEFEKKLKIRKPMSPEFINEHSTTTDSEEPTTGGTPESSITADLSESSIADSRKLTTGCLPESAATADSQEHATASIPESEESWVDVMFVEVLKKMDEKTSRALLQYRFGRELINRILRAFPTASSVDIFKASRK